MAKVHFNNKVKYKGVIYEPGMVFEVADKDVKSLKADGAILEEKSSRRKAAEENPEGTPGDDGSENDGDGTPQE